MAFQTAAQVQRPRRWDAPLDRSMTDADVAYLRGVPPFAEMDPAHFPRTTPLEAILRNDCRIRRCAPGEVVLREGDYGESAFLVLAGRVRAFLSRLAPEALGRAAPRRIGWRESLAGWWNASRWPEVRTRDQIAPPADGDARLAHGSTGLAVFLQDFAAVARGHETLPLGAGELFGEVTAMYRTPRTATVVADEEATLLEIRWQGLRLLHRDPALGRQLDRHYRRHWLLVHLRETPLLRFLPEAALRRVADAAQMRSFGRLEWHAPFRQSRRLEPSERIEAEPLVVPEGQFPTELVLVRSGFARVCRRHGVGWQTLAYLGKGQLFGLAEIAHNERRSDDAPPLPMQQSLRAVGLLDTVHLPVEVVAEHILPHVRREELPAPVPPPGAGERGAERHRERHGEPSSRLPTGLLEFLVDHRLNNGRQAMLIDLNRCTRCDDCVRACAATHDGNPRFVRTGPQYDSVQVAEACMHCADPVCMIGCPTGAIARDPHTGTIAIHDPVCIGCGTCAAACPYDNIRMVAPRDPEGRPWQDESTGLPIAKATKCDLCQSQPSGPACQAACPHDALVRIDLSDLSEVEAWWERSR